MRLLPVLCSALLLASAATGQSLRRGLVDADAVFVGRQVGKKPHGDALALHRVQVIEHLRGADGYPAVTVIDWPKLSLHNRPIPRQSRLYCLQDASAIAQRLGLPESGAPYFKMVGWSGSNPLIGRDRDQDPIVRFARVLADSENGTATVITAAALATMAVNGDASVRTEVTHYLTERGDLRGKLSGLHWNQLTARATGEVEDVDYKIALAQLGAEQRLDGLVDALAVSLGPVTDPRYARCVGRIAKVLHGEQATRVLADRLRNIGQTKDRSMVLMAIGATNTQSALDALMQMDDKDDAVVAALKEHRSRRAQNAVRERR
ncbi:MAG: hypothetical protein KAI24_15470 [Planctomycetes bacterium]|nr:hypothetical protein [Planctomycetota bacterium]